MTERTNVGWLHDFATLAAKTDRFAEKSDHAALLAAGLIGEAGSIVAELKKVRRDTEAYPAYHEKMLEEVGDFLWYFVRLCALCAPGLLDGLEVPTAAATPTFEENSLRAHLEFGAAVGRVLAALCSGATDIRSELSSAWTLLVTVCAYAHVSLRDAATQNAAKVRSRWPEVREYSPLFDNACEVEDQLPRNLELEFRERRRGSQGTVVLRCNGINFGDRLTDNIEDTDGYRFHDIFHFAYAAHLGWSPVLRALLRAKRKADSKIDEAQDGARAAIIEEAVSAIVFSRAKRLNFFDGLEQVDLDLLKTIKEFVTGFEVDRIPLWQWERAILDGYRVFRQLLSGRGGRVSLDLPNRGLIYAPLTDANDRTDRS